MSLAPHWWSPARAASAAVRMTGFVGLWLAIAGTGVRDLPAGLATAAAATWVSLRLLPPAPHWPDALAVVRLLLRFLSQGVLAGLDVAWRVFDPRLPLRPGFVLFPARLPAGSARSAFCALESLLPGTLPVGTHESGAILVHCLDTEQPVQAQMATDEALFIDALGEGRDG
jgi:multicomponent Na+:H+ antiporter subunit E